MLIYLYQQESGASCESKRVGVGNAPERETVKHLPLKISLRLTWLVSKEMDLRVFLHVIVYNVQFGLTHRMEVLWMTCKEAASKSSLTLLLCVMSLPDIVCGVAR